VFTTILTMILIKATVSTQIINCAKISLQQITSIFTIIIRTKPTKQMDVYNNMG
jgi:hypothetical protein